MKKFTHESDVNRLISLAINKNGDPIKDIAHRSDIERSHLSKIRTAGAKVDLGKVRRLAETLNLYPSDLLPPDWIAPISSNLKTHEKHRISDAISRAILAYRDYVAQKGAPTTVDITEFADVLAFIVMDDEIDGSPTNIDIALRARESLKK